MQIPVDKRVFNIHNCGDENEYGVLKIGSRWGLGPRKGDGGLSSDPGRAIRLRRGFGGQAEMSTTEGYGNLRKATEGKKKFFVKASEVSDKPAVIAGHVSRRSLK